MDAAASCKRTTPLRRFRGPNAIERSGFSGKSGPVCRVRCGSFRPSPAAEGLFAANAGPNTRTLLSALSSCPKLRSDESIRRVRACGREVLNVMGRVLNLGEGPFATPGSKCGKPRPRALHASQRSQSGAARPRFRGLRRFDHRFGRPVSLHDKRTGGLSARPRLGAAAPTSTSKRAVDRTKS